MTSMSANDEAKANSIPVDASSVLDFWFGAPGSAVRDTDRVEWFRKDAAFDAEIRSRFGPLIEQAGKDFAGGLKVVTVNVDTAPEISHQFGVQGIPTLLLLRDGREVSREVGALPGRALRSWIDGELAL